MRRVRVRAARTCHACGATIPKGARAFLVFHGNHNGGSTKTVWYCECRKEMYD